MDHGCAPRAVGRLAVALCLAAACTQPEISKAVGADAAAPTGGGSPATVGEDAGPTFMLPDARDGQQLEAPPPVTSELDCAGAAKTPGNAGCSFYAAEPPIYLQSCYAMFVVNPGTQPAKLTLARAG